MIELYPPEFFAQAQDTCWSIFAAPDETPDKVAALLADWPKRFASHQLAGVLTMGLGDYAAGRTEMELARGWAGDEEEEFVFGPEQFDGKERALGALAAMGPDIWSVDFVYDIIPGGPVKFQQVMRIIQLASGGLCVINPVNPSEQIRRQVDALGPVELLVTHTGFHYMFIAPWQEAYPEAKLIGPQLHREKPEVQHLRYDGYLDDGAPFSPGEIEQIHFDGHAFDETALYHAKSKSLLLTDIAVSTKQPATKFFDFYGWLWAGTGPSAASPITAS